MSFWGITTYFNPSKYAKRFENYMAFRKSSKAQALKLLTVELALNGEPFVLSDTDADLLIQVRSNSVMWHKERLINIGIENLPETCDKICWLDCDLIFLNNNWVKETSVLLNNFDLVQPFSSVLQTDHKLRVINESYGFGYYCKKKIPSSTSFKQGQPEKDPSKHATWGFGWAAKKDIITSMGGLYDRNIVGGGDNIIKLSFGFAKIKEDTFSEEHKKDLLKFFEKNEDKQLKRSNISCTSGSAKHLWHGDRKDRGYGERDIILKEANYDPQSHIQINNDRCFEFTASGKALEHKIKTYFDSRKEDGHHFFEKSVSKKIL